MKGTSPLSVAIATTGRALADSAEMKGFLQKAMKEAMDKMSAEIIIGAKGMTPGSFSGLRSILAPERWSFGTIVRRKPDSGVPVSLTDTRRLLVVGPGRLDHNFRAVVVGGAFFGNSNIGQVDDWSRDAWEPDPD